MSQKIVVARYNENIDWLRPEFPNCIIYNKGQPLNLPNEIALRNLGRESHTYLQQIIQNQDQLPDVVIFTQGKISDHFPGKDDVGFLLNLRNQAITQGKSHTKQVCRNEKELTWGSSWNQSGGKWYLENNYKNGHILFGAWFEKQIGKKQTVPFPIYANALFAVRKEKILQHPIQYYMKLLEQVNWHVCPVEGHFMERSWYAIFQ